MKANKTAAKGLMIVNTGKGKGKTTAAIGMMLRAWGRGFRVCVIQFIKSETANYGETRAARKLGIEWYALGTGCIFDREETPDDVAMAVKAWELAREKIAGREYDLIVLDEFTYPLKFGWLAEDEVLPWLAANRPPDLHLVVTGRDASPSLIEAADLVTEMCKIKHPFDRGIKGQPGVEF